METGWITTATVLQKLRDFENRDAWEAFTHRFRRPILSFARGMGLAAHDAEDVAQETLAAFAQAFREGRYDASKGRLSRFLFGIAFRQALKARRVRRDVPEANLSGSGTGLLSQVPDEATATGIWDTEWEQAVLEECLRQVRAEVEPSTYKAFDLSVRDELPPAEVAAKLGMSVKSVYNAKHRVLKRVRELREEFETHG